MKDTNPIPVLDQMAMRRFQVVKEKKRVTQDNVPHGWTIPQAPKYTYEFSKDGLVAMRVKQ